MQLKDKGRLEHVCVLNINLVGRTQTRKSLKHTMVAADLQRDLVVGHCLSPVMMIDERSSKQHNTGEHHFFKLIP